MASTLDNKHSHFAPDFDTPGAFWGPIPLTPPMTWPQLVDDKNWEERVKNYENTR